jgi:small redox-active disulfide protein 2
MKIQVFGSGCTSCKRLHELTTDAVEELGLEMEVEYIKDVTKLIEMGIMQSPVLTIDGKPVMIGLVPNKEKIKDLIAEASK